MADPIGGQAVIEGVMMKSKKKVAIAVRGVDGSIRHKVKHVRSVTEKYPWKLPFVRGAIIMFETMILGMKALNYSANEAVDDGTEGQKKNLSTWAIIGSMFFAIIFAIFLFKFIPLGSAQLITGFFPAYNNLIIFNFIEGFFKISILVGYIFLISKFPDMRRVFQYHGAEHKTVHCNESGEDLTVENVRKYTTLHPRCGTSFILFVLLLSIFIYMIIPLDVPFLAKLGIRVLFLPLIAGLGYEFIRLSGKYSDSKLLKSVIAPGLWLQKLTTNEPSDDQIEVAIEALKLTKEA